MEEKNYSVEEILKEARQRSQAHSPKEISHRADRQAQKILESLKADKSRNPDEAFEAMFRELTARAKTAREPEKPELPQEKTELPQEKTKLPQEKPERAQREERPVPAPTEQSREAAIKSARKTEKKKSANELLRGIMPGEENKIESALRDKREETSGARERRLTKTGVIRKANALIEAKPAEANDAAAQSSAARMGAIIKKEKVVGEKEDIQTKAYHEYIRSKEKRAQDTGMIKSVDMKAAEKTKVLSTPAAASRDTEKTKVPAQALIDNETNTEKTIVGKQPEHIISRIYHTGNIEGQTRLEGFFDDEEVEKISEDELEEQLEINRREKIDSFELEKAFKEKNGEAVEAASQSSLDDTYAPEKETPVINDVIDYNSGNDQRAVYLELENLLGRFKLRTVLTFAAELAVVVIGIFGAGVFGDFGLGTAGERVYIIINTALLFLMLVFNARAIFKGLKALFMLKPSADSLLSFAGVVGLAHCVAALTLGENGAGVSHLYVGAIGFALLLNCFGKRSMIRRVFKNFRFLIKKGDKYSAACITDPKEVQAFAKGSENEYTDIRYNAKTAFPTRFLANSYADDPADTVARYTVYPAIGLAVLIALVSFFIGKDWMASISAGTAALLIAVPACALMAFNKALENADSVLLKERGTITGFAAVEDTAQTTAVVVSARELFPAGTCSLKGMKLFKKMQMDEAILYAASVLSETEHPLKSVFMESISEVQDHMPQSFDTAFESKLGLSTWIYDRKVLLGNQDMMGAHGIEIPTTAKPEEYAKGNQRVMFLAIDGAVYAMFVVEYFSDPDTEYELQRLEASGIQVFVQTQDSGVDKALVSEVFDLEEDSVKILGMLAGNMFEEKMQRAVYNEAKLVNRGDTVTFMRSVTACSILNSQFSLLKTLLYIASGLGIVLIAIFSLMGAISSIGPVHLVIYAAFWMIVTNVIPRVYKAVPKR